MITREQHGLRGAVALAAFAAAVVLSSRHAPAQGTSAPSAETQNATTSPSERAAELNVLWQVDTGG
jgi:hypothetical protein